MNFFETIISEAEALNCPICNIALSDKIKGQEYFECDKCNLILHYNAMYFDNNKINYRIIHWKESKYQKEEHRLLIYFNEQNIYFCTFYFEDHRINRGYDFYHKNMNIEMLKDIASFDDLYSFGEYCLKKSIFS